MSRHVHQSRYTVALTAADVGERVMVRYAHGGDGPPLTDAVGNLLSWSGGVLQVATRRGLVDVAEAALVAGKVVPLPRVARAADASVADLQRLSALSWRPLETARLGGWRLRAGAGFTGRANSVLPLGDPGLPLDDAIAHVMEWYGQRGIRPRFQLPQPITAALTDELVVRGWSTDDVTEVMVGDVGAALALSQGADLPPVDVADAPSDGWLSRYHYRGGQLPADALRVLTNHEGAGFASVVEDGATVAIARATVDERWLCVQAVEVDASARRRGLGRHVMGGVLQWGQDNGARHVHLQVMASNEPAHALYDRLGFSPHHRYHYSSYSLPPT
ncbi:GNAT family N-acetyltransferase [Acidothermaceae bacterium B102]|nr:GNAT family N-acetyltransferase [Acidothermaceae bacterium B102]